MTVANCRRRLSSGVEIGADDIADVRVWAPSCRTVDVLVERTDGNAMPTPLEREHDGSGFFSGRLAGAKPGDRYWFVLDGDRRRPDPVSRFQPEGPHGPSM